MMFIMVIRWLLINPIHGLITTCTEKNMPLIKAGQTKTSSAIAKKISTATTGKIMARGIMAGEMETEKTTRIIVKTTAKAIMATTAGTNLYC
jgi:hypothetical protein